MLATNSQTNLPRYIKPALNSYAELPYSIKQKKARQVFHLRALLSKEWMLEAINNGEIIT